MPYVKCSHCDKIWYKKTFEYYFDKEYQKEQDERAERGDFRFSMCSSCIAGQRIKK